MDIVYNFERKGIFGNLDFCSDSKKDASADDLKKAVQAFKKDRNSSLNITTSAYTYCLLWDNYTDYELEVFTVIPYSSWNDRGDAFKVAYTTMKKELAKAVKRERVIAEESAC